LEKKSAVDWVEMRALIQMSVAFCVGFGVGRYTEFNWTYTGLLKSADSFTARLNSRIKSLLEREVTKIRPIKAASEKFDAKPPPPEGSTVLWPRDLRLLQFPLVIPEPEEPTATEKPSKTPEKLQTQSKENPRQK